MPAVSFRPTKRRAVWQMLERLPALTPVRHHVVMMHYWPFMETLDEPNWDLTDPDQYYDWYFSINEPHRGCLWQLLQDAGVEILFCGHVHTGRPDIDHVRRLNGTA